jgi:uncharacterized membrane protein YphA (DoxX/SURF4 family)
MSISSTLDRVHTQVKQNQWLWYFAIFCRVTLAAGFLPSGFVKIMGERFTALSVNHPMGSYLEALHHTGYYYTFIGVVQMTAAVLLLIPWTATLGAVLYFPIILNICILSFAVRFDGSLLTSPLMVLANLYLLCWDYDKLKYILPFGHVTTPGEPLKKKVMRTKFPIGFFGGVFATVVLSGFVLFNLYEIKPCNTLKDCQTQCQDSSNPEACEKFCDCIHNQGQPLTKCLEEYNKALIVE